MQFTVKGKPQGKARPRFSPRSHTIYTPSKTTAYERIIALEFKTAGGKCLPAGHYVAVDVLAFFPIPKSYSRHKRQDCIDGKIRPDKKPDSDNILKVVLDGLNGYAYDDDKQIVEAICRKYYTGDEEGYIWVAVREVNTAGGQNDEGK